MPVSFIEPIDPAELASRFSTEDMLDPLPEGLDEEWRLEHLERILEVMSRLPERESDLVDLYFFRGKKQVDIADIFGITQAAVSYRLQRAKERIRFLVELPDASKEDVYQDLMEWQVLEDRLDAKIFREMYESTCQSEVADRLDLTQGRVRHRFLSNLAKIGDLLVDRLLSWTESNLPEGTMERDELVKRLEDIRSRRKRKEWEEEDYEEAIQEVFEELRADPNAELGDLGRIYHYYRTFVQIRYNFNILREIELPRWSNRSTNVLA